ncbi:CdaR family transcriptional regulator [Pseudonocardia sp. ICBG1293]|uniref:PucR family transcriptional regulator n=1 Tax=Pseudonocardia sp. ICBG1293 TaxID=2844382 RepID=UPI001CCF45C3|nr:helix-turn-helix domain-containing protein [Pseudonocardia sp. ICBG1293]
MLGETATALIDHLAEELSRSVVVDDPAVQVLYASAHYGDADETRVAAVLNHGAGPRIRGYVLAQGVLSWTRAGIIPASDELGMHARVCVPVRWEGRLLALVMVMDADGSLTTGELGRITEVADRLALSLQDLAGTADAARADERRVLDLLGDDPVARSRALAGLGRVPGPGAVAVVVAVPGAGADDEHAAIALRTALSGRRRDEPGGWPGAVGRGTAVLLADPATTGSGDLPGQVRRVVDRVGELAHGRFRCVAGIGGPVTAPELPAASVTQARAACAAAELGLRPPVARWAELGALGPLLAAPPDALTDQTLPDELHRLRAADPDGRLVATVRAYLDEAGNGPAAAARLHIHRTSLYYRLDRVTRLTGLDMSDGATRLALHLGLGVLDVVEARKRASVRQTEHGRA